MSRAEWIEGSRTLLIVSDEDVPMIQKETDASLLVLHDLDWNKDLSPWYAEKVFRKGEDFSGNGDQTLQMIIEMMDEHRESYDQAVIAGYSLAGLFALYACTVSDRFEGCVSASGSLWFPRFEEWLKEHPVHCKAVYLSLGDQEKKTKNPVMASVEEKTEEAYRLIGSYTDCFFEMNPGNHFSHPEERLMKGIRHILKKL